MSIQRVLTVRSKTLTEISQLKKGKRELLNAVLYRFRKNFEKFKFGDLSVWHEMELFKAELEKLQGKFTTAKKNIMEVLPFDTEQLKKHQVRENSKHYYTLYSLLDTAFLECIERIDEVFALLELALIQPNIPNQDVLKKHKNSLKHYCLKKLILYIYQARKPSFYMGNYCQSKPSVRKSMLARIDMTFESFSQMVAKNSVGLLSDSSKTKLLDSSTY